MIILGKERKGRPLYTNYIRNSVKALYRRKFQKRSVIILWLGLNRKIEKEKYG